jgi:hypothetical protein
MYLAVSKNYDPNGFYQAFEDYHLHKFFQKIEEKRIFPNLFYEATITLILKTKDITRKV